MTMQKKPRPDNQTEACSTTWRVYTSYITLFTLLILLGGEYAIIVCEDLDSAFGLSSLFF